MAKSLDSLLQDFVNKSYEEIRGAAAYGIDSIIPELKKIFGEELAFTALLSMISSCIAVDGTFSAKEQQLVHEVLGLTPDKAKTLIENSADIDFADKFIDACDLETKMHLVTICLCFFAVDERISSNEVKLLARFIED